MPTLPHPCFREAIELHQSLHIMRPADYRAAMRDLLDNEDGTLAAGLHRMLHGMSDAPACLVHAVFLAGVLYGRDTPARTEAAHAP